MLANSDCDAMWMKFSYIATIFVVAISWLFSLFIIFSALFKNQSHWNGHYPCAKDTTKIGIQLVHVFFVCFVFFVSWTFVPYILHRCSQSREVKSFASYGISRTLSMLLSQSLYLSLGNYILVMFVSYQIVISVEQWMRAKIQRWKHSQGLSLIQKENPMCQILYHQKQRILPMFLKPEQRRHHCRRRPRLRQRTKLVQEWKTWPRLLRPFEPNQTDDVEPVVWDAQTEVQWETAVAVDDFLASCPVGAGYIEAYHEHSKACQRCCNLQIDLRGLWTERGNLQTGGIFHRTKDRGWLSIRAGFVSHSRKLWGFVSHVGFNADYRELIGSVVPRCGGRRWWPHAMDTIKVWGKHQIHFSCNRTD